MTSGTKRDVTAQDFLACEVETLQSKIAKLETVLSLCLDRLKEDKESLIFCSRTIDNMGTLIVSGGLMDHCTQKPIEIVTDKIDDIIEAVQIALQKKDQ